MDLEKTQLDQLSRLVQSSMNTSKEIAEISGQDKVTVTLVTVGLTYPPHHLHLAQQDNIF